MPLYRASQILRPTAVFSNAGGWDGNDGGANLHLYVDEFSADDADFIRGPTDALGVVHQAKVRLPTSGVLKPSVTHSHVLSYRYQKDAAGGQTTAIAVEVQNGDESIVANATHANVSENWTAGTLTLSAAQAANITDYNDLLVQVATDHDLGLGNRRGQVSFIQFLIPRPRMRDRMLRGKTGVGR